MPQRGTSLAPVSCSCASTSQGTNFLPWQVHSARVQACRYRPCRHRPSRSAFPPRPRPISTLPPRTVLNIPLFNCAGQLFFCLITTDELPQLPRLAGYIRPAFILQGQLGEVVCRRVVAASRLMEHIAALDLFCTVHRGIGVLDQRFRIAATFGADGNPDARPDSQLPVRRPGTRWSWSMQFSNLPAPLQPSSTHRSPAPATSSRCPDRRRIPAPGFRPPRRDQGCVWRAAWSHPLRWFSSYLHSLAPDPRRRPRP